MKAFRRALVALSLLTAAGASQASTAFSEGTQLLEDVQNLVTGPVGAFIAVLAIVFAAYSFLMGEGRGASKPVVIALAVGAVLGAASFVRALPFGSGLGL